MRKLPSLWCNFCVYDIQFHPSSFRIAAQLMVRNGLLGLSVAPVFIQKLREIMEAVRCRGDTVNLSQRNIMSADLSCLLYQHQDLTTSIWPRRFTCSRLSVRYIYCSPAVPPSHAPVHPSPTRSALFSLSYIDCLHALKHPCSFRIFSQI